jgi:hypothetical protein
MNKSCSTSHINLINGASKGRKKNGSPQCHTRSFSPLRQVLTSHLPSRTPCLLMEESPRSSCTPAAQESWIAESQIYLESFSFQINHLAWIGSMHRSPRTQDILQPACAVLLIACRDKGWWQKIGQAKQKPHENRRQYQKGKQKSKLSWGPLGWCDIFKYD